MKDEELERLLRDTATDERMSRSEGRALREVLLELGPDAPTRARIRGAAFRIARERMQDSGARKSLEWLENVMKSLSATEPDAAVRSEARAWFSPGDSCWQAIRDLIIASRSTIDIAVFTITDNRISRALVDAHRKGVKIRIITDNQKSYDRGSDVSDLEDAAIDLRVDRSEYHMHHKFAIYDRTQLLTGSYNWTRGAADYNEENLLLTADSRIVRRYQQAFDELWRKVG